jgi:hypothetical protein
MPGSAGAATVVYGAGDFTAWGAEAFIGSVGGQVVSIEATGGNPDGNLRVTTATNSETFTAHFDPAFVHDPSQGEIAYISASIEYRVVFAFDQGQGFSSLLLEQGGSYFHPGGGITGPLVDGTWRTFEIVDAHSGNFGRLAGTGTLDFTPSGAPIRVGFWTGNSGGNGIEVRYDNWTASITQVPAPPALVAALTAFGVLPGRLRRRVPA